MFFQVLSILISIAREVLLLCLCVWLKLPVCLSDEHGRVEIGMEPFWRSGAENSPRQAVTSSQSSSYRGAAAVPGNLNLDCHYLLTPLPLGPRRL